MNYKKKLLIVGDSFGTSMGHAVNKDCWFNHELLTQDFDITNLCSPGACQLYIHNKFLDNYKNYNNVLYLITSPIRITYNDHSGRVYHITSDMVRLDYEIVNAPSHVTKKKLQTIRDYFTDIMQHDLYDYASLGMINDAKKKFPNITLVPGFGNKFNDHQSLTLLDFSNKELAIWGLGLEAFRFGEPRAAHLTDENNHMVAKWIKDRLDGNVYDLSWDMFITPTFEDKKKYFPKYC